MKIVRPEDCVYEKIEFEKRSPGVLSFVGAGGKTTLIYRLSEELKARGQSVLITTTTKMYCPDKAYIEWTGAECMERIKESLVKEGVVTVGRRLFGKAVSFDEREDKMEGVLEEDYDRLLSLADVLLVEADGAKRKPLKVPALHEPVIFPGTDLVVGVLGLRSIGMSIEEASFRPEDVAEFLNTEVTHCLTREDLEVIADSPFGLKKKVDCAFVAVGNYYE